MPVNTIENSIASCISTPPIYLHIVTLINRRTGEERSLIVSTSSDRFAEVLREVFHLRLMHGLQGFEIYEVIDCNTPF